jgi:methanogenic corrinoid protein MtbC1
LPGIAMDALFVGWEDQENLGLRYIMSYLESKGYRTTLIPYASDADEDVVRAVLQSEDGPKLIGFSIIFQYNLHEFGNLMNSLRRAGVRGDLHVMVDVRVPSRLSKRQQRIQHR